jgi:hypothetical protein
MTALKALTAIAIVALTGCTSDDDGATCALVAHYQSVDELECGLTPDGTAMCHWMLSFTATAGDASTGTLSWSHSDVGESGSYTCDGTAITANVTGRDVTVVLSATTGTLVFDGIAYEPI